MMNIAEALFYAQKTVMKDRRCIAWGNLKKIWYFHKKCGKDRLIGTKSISMEIQKKSKSTMVIGIDHGCSGMKTVHEVFTSGCKEISTEPAFTENLLEYAFDMEETQAV